MKEYEFNALMHCGMYVNPNLLEKGIYTCPKPHLYMVDETIETLIDNAIKVQDMMGKHHISDKYFESLKQCQMVKVFITESENPNQAQLKDKVFALANKLAVAGYGNEAVRIHDIHNQM